MILKELKISTWVGDATNCYIIMDEETKETIVVDPAGEVDKIVEMLEILKSKLKYIYTTHCHGDHIYGVNELKERCGGKLLIHRLDKEGLNEPEINLCPYIGMEKITLELDSIVEHDDTIHIGENQFKVIHTPGHTIGSSCLYNEKESLIFSGDTIFNGTWGRTDLPTGNRKQIFKSIGDSIMTLPDNTIVYPGHGKTTLVGEEKPIYLELKPKLW